MRERERQGYKDLFLRVEDELRNVLVHCHLLAFGVWGSGLEFGVWGLRFGVWGLGFGVWGLWFWVCDLNFEVWGLGFGI